MNDDIVEALSKARWNETIEVTVDQVNNDSDEDDDDGRQAPTPAPSRQRHRILLAASLDTTNGGIQWNEVRGVDSRGEGDDGDREDEFIHRYLQTKKWMFPMLNDNTRNEMYQTAIERASADVIRRFVGVDTHDDQDIQENDSNIDRNMTSNFLRCLDIGSGTGLLAMLSARSLQKCWEDEISKNKNDYLVNVEREEQQHRRQQRQRRVHVKSLEMSSPMAKLAHKIVKQNGFHFGHDGDNLDHEKSTDEECRKLSSKIHRKVEASVNIVEGHSCDVPEPITQEKRFHLCTSELLESGLLGEGWLPAMRDAWERHLHPSAVVVPQRAKIYVQVIADCGDNNDGNSDDDGMQKALEDYIEPLTVLGGFPNESSMKLFTSSSDNSIPETAYGMTSPVCQMYFGVDVPFQTENENESWHGMKQLSDPIEVAVFDVTSKETIPTPELHSSSTDFICTDSGKAKGVIFWWDLELYDDLIYSTRPGAQPFQDHWHPCLFLFPTNRVVNVEKGQPALIRTKHDDKSISFAVHCKTYHDAGVETSSKRPRLSSESQANGINFSSIASPQRCLQLNCVDRLTLLRNAIGAVLDRIGKDKAHVLDVSDFSLCGIMAALLGARYVTSLESSTGSNALATASACLARLGNNLSLAGSEEHGNDNQNQFQIIQCYPEQVTLEALVGGQPANIVVAEPFYTMLEGWTQVDALNLFYTLRGLRQRRALTEDVVCVPRRVKIMAQAFDFPNLGNAYKPCDTMVCGFHHEILNQYWSLDKRCISQSVWNTCSSRQRKPLTEPVVIATLDYQQNETNLPSHTSIKYNKVGTCHIIVSWVDYELPTYTSDIGEDDIDVKNRQQEMMSTTTLSTNTMLYNQSIYVLPEPVVVTEADIQNGLTIDMCHVFSPSNH